MEIAKKDIGKTATIEVTDGVLYGVIAGKDKDIVSIGPYTVIELDREWVVEKEPIILGLDDILNVIPGQSDVETVVAVNNARFRGEYTVGDKNGN